MDLLGGDQRESGLEVEAHLVAEHAQRAGAGAVGLLDALVEDPLHQVEVLPHPVNLATRGTRLDAPRRSMFRVGRRCLPYGMKYIGLGTLTVRSAKPPRRSLNWSPRLATMS